MTEEKKNRLEGIAKKFVKDFLYKHGIIKFEEYTDTAILLNRIKFPYIVFYANRDEYSLAEIQILTDTMTKLLNSNLDDKPRIEIVVVTVQNGLGAVTREELKWYADTYSVLSKKCNE